MLAACPILAGKQQYSCAVLGGAAVLVLLVAVWGGWATVILWSIGALGVEFLLALIDGTHVEALGAALYGTALLLVAELAYWSIELRTPTAAEPGLRTRRVSVIASLVLGSLAVLLLAQAVVRAPVLGALDLTLVGVAAVVAAFALAVCLIWRLRP